MARFVDNFPNDCVEQTEDVHEGGVPRYDDAIGRNFQELSAAGFRQQPQVVVVPAGAK